MHRPRLSIVQLMAVVLFVGLGLAGLKIADLAARIKQAEENASVERESLTKIIGELRDRLDRHGNVYDFPDGSVIGANDERQEVFVNVTRAHGARPGLRLSVFDGASPHISTAKPKGMIELTDVDEPFSSARVIEKASPAEAIRGGDIIYSPIWSPNIPTHFAIIGKIDVNRDDKDDSDELMRLIRDAGGIIDYELPPPGAGPEAGKLSVLIDWYVIDYPWHVRDEFVTRMGKVIKEARLDGIRPMPIERLLPYLGHGLRQPDVGGAEAKPIGGGRSTSELHAETPR
jgi:hypothetical protein